jgi:hypothetical protein
VAKKIEVQIVGDADSLSRAFGQATKSASNFERGLQKASRGAMVALAGIGTGAVFAVKAASDLSEQINKTSVVFGKSAPEIQKWATTTASALGLSQRAALEATGVFGNMLVPMGFARAKAAEMSQSMVTLAADMASFNNANPAEVLDSLRAGLAGETEPLRRFGVFLNDARLKAEALSMGLYSGVGALDANAKAQATYSIILKDTADAQGDFARTSDGLANQQRILKAQLEDLGATLGATFIPLAQKAASALQEFAGFAGKHAVEFQVLAGAITAAAVATIALNFAVAANPFVLAGLAVTALTVALVILWRESDTAKKAILALGLVVAALPTALIIAWRESETFRTVVVASFNAAMTAANAMRTAAVAVAVFLEGPFHTAVGVATTAINAARVAAAAIATAFNAVRTAAVAVANVLSGPLEVAFGTAKAVISAVARVVDTLAGALWSAVNAANALASAIRSLPSMPRISVPGLPGIGIGGRAAGGPVRGRTPYMVGERGPELFVPGRSGSIVPNNQLAGAGGVTVNIYAPIGSERQLESMVVSALTNVRNRGGLA